MKNFNLSLRKPYLFAIMGALILSSCSTDDTPSEDVSAIRQAEAANLNANAQVAAAQAALINAQVQVEVAQAEQINLQNALIAIQNATEQAESDLTIAELQAQMVAAETARVNAQLALNQAMNTLDESMAEMQADEVRNLMSKLSQEQGNLNQLMSDRKALVSDLNLANFSLEFGVDYSNESSLISLQSALESQQESLASLETNLALLKESANGSTDVSEKLNNLLSENISINSKLDSVEVVQNEITSERTKIFNEVSAIATLKSDYESYLNNVISFENNQESTQTTLNSRVEQLTLFEDQLSQRSTELIEAQGRLETANQEFDTRVAATVAAKAVIPGLESTIENAELAVNMAQINRNEYTGTDATVISDLDLAVTEAGTALTDAQTALSDALIVINDVQNLENNYYAAVVAPEENTIYFLNNEIDNIQLSINNLKSDIKDLEQLLVYNAAIMEDAQIFIAENKEAYEQGMANYQALYDKLLQANIESSKISNLQSSLSSLYFNNQSLINYYSNINSNNTGYSNQVKSQEEHIANATLGIKDLESQIKEVENNMIVKVEDLQQEIEAITDELAAIDVQIEAQTGVVTHYKDLLSQALAE